MIELNIKDNIEEYLSISKYINWNDESILSKADEFKQNYADDVALVKALYEFVRDEIKHSWDVQDKRVTQSATEVLEQGVVVYAGQKRIYWLPCLGRVEYLQVFAINVLLGGMYRKPDFAFMH